jgi:hypothetical protein
VAAFGEIFGAEMRFEAGSANVVDYTA